MRISFRGRAYSTSPASSESQGSSSPPCTTSTSSSKHSSNVNNRPRFQGLSRLRSNSLTSNLSFNMFRPNQKAGSPPVDAPARNSSVFGSIANLGHRRPTRSQTDALITLSVLDKSDEDNDGTANKNYVVTDDQLASNVTVSPFKFNLIPTTILNSDNESENNSNSGKERYSDESTFTQAGGHDGSFQMDGATLVKKATDREALFYENALKGEWPVSLLPKYYGRVGNDAISIENLTHGYSRPCVVDLKMGIHTFESDEKSLIKKLKMNSLDHLTGSRSEGCRLEGLSMYRTIDKQTVSLKGSKRQTHALSMNVRISIKDLLTFFLTDEYGVRTDLALRFQTTIERILAQFESKNDKYLFIGSSILLIYDNDIQSPHMRWARALRKLHTIAPHVRLSEDQISGLTRRTSCDVRMIDFAHTGPLPRSETRDHGYIRGLKSILKALKAIRAYRSKPIFSVQSAAIDMMEEHRAKNLAALASGGASDDNAFTFGTVLKELTAVSHIDEGGSELSEETC